MVKNPPANARDVRDAGSIPGLGRSPGGGHGNPLQHSCLENPMDRGVLRATVHGVAESDTTEATWQRALLPVSSPPLPLGSSCLLISPLPGLSPSPQGSASRLSLSPPGCLWCWSAPARQACVGTPLLLSLSPRRGPGHKALLTWLSENWNISMASSTRPSS